MQQLFIRALNSEYESRDDGADYDRAEDALAIGVRSAVALAADELGRGSSNAAIEVSVEGADGALMLRSVVAISVSPLMVRHPPSTHAND